MPPRHQSAPRLLDLAGGLSRAQRIDAAGAEREAWEEAQARIAIDGLLAVYDIPRISQVQIIYRARLDGAGIRRRAESLEVELFAWDDIPWDELAFPSVRWALDHYRESAASGDITARHAGLAPVRCAPRHMCPVPHLPMQHSPLSRSSACRRTHGADAVLRRQASCIAMLRPSTGPG